MIIGKVGMVWKIRHWMNGDVARQIADAKDLGLTGVCLKVVDDSIERWESNSLYPTNQNADYLPALIPALRSAGIDVTAWGYTYGRYKTAPYTSIGAAEGAKTAVVLKKYGITKYLIDAETEYERTELNMRAEAKAYMAALKAGVPTAELYFCSYRYPAYHMGLPWSEFLPGCVGHAPQVYFLQMLNAGAGAAQLVESNKQLQALKAMPVIGIAPTYEHTSPTGVHWRASKEQLAGFFQKAKELAMPGVGVWCLDLASPEQLAALKEFSWVTGAPPPTEPPCAATVAEYLAALDAWARNPTTAYKGVRPPAA